MFHKKGSPNTAKYSTEAEAFLKVTLDWNVISREASLYASTILCVRKKYCTGNINKITIKYREGPIKTRDVLRLSQGVRYLTTLDITHLSCSETVSMCLLLCRSAYVLWWPSEECRGFARAYVVDILITSNNFYDHFRHVHIVLTKFKMQK
ncbi:hypothetical protein PR048_010775 [Dryococelus australis]|uniref:Uncharacterized protein n=1 Tax=Dryococelus australis TaxID=614101 RepID=A0ABQ9I3N0_9NEOP|nr:hypothetical protein PR048_010775 [Dryococelus australis]